ncbi:MAG: GHKL domain-containing protein [Desulfobacula sp.]|nr:GHKL domain-containing protein [Desulfobacula sp.]
MNEDLKQKVQNQAAMIIQAEKMASVGLLAAGIAHEINNPIAFINSNLSAVKKYFKKIIFLYEKYADMEKFLRKSKDSKAAQILKELDDFKKENKIGMIMDDLEDLADESIDGINRIRTIVNDLKTFSRIDESEYKHIDINHAIDTTLNIVKNEYKHKVVIEKKYGKIPEIKCFPQKISQVFMNILINASQAIKEKGTIKIATQLLTKGKRKDDSFIEITISDTGCGIPQENLDKLFDPFFTTKPVGSGTGLGLSIVYEIIKTHKGNIKVKSKVGEGTIITISLPMKISGRSKSRL